MMRRKRFEEEVTRLISVYDDDRLMLLTYEMINSGKSNEEILIQMGLDNLKIGHIYSLLRLFNPEFRTHHLARLTLLKSESFFCIMSK